MRLPSVEYRSVLITGCSSGIGLATARRLRARGWQVIASARQAKDVERLAHEGFRTIPLDVADEASVKAAALEALRIADGKLGALVNNAGFGQAGAAEDVSRAALRYQFEVNVFGLQDLTNRLLPAMLRAGSGRIVHISSVLGRVVLPMYGSYCASKHAVEALADAQRVELRGTGVGLILVEPGPITTEFRRTAARMVRETMPGAQSAYGSYYEKEVERRVQLSKTESRMSKPPEAVAKVIEHALTTRNPCARYAVTLPAQVAPVLRKILPDFLYDAAVSARVPERGKVTSNHRIVL